MNLVIFQRSIINFESRWDITFQSLGGREGGSKKAKRITDTKGVDKTERSQERSRYIIKLVYAERFLSVVESRNVARRRRLVEGTPPSGPGSIPLNPD